MANGFTNPFRNPRGFFSSQPGGFFAPPQQQGFTGFLSDPRVTFGLSFAGGATPIEALNIAGQMKDVFAGKDEGQPFAAYDNELERNVFVTQSMFELDPSRYEPKRTPSTETKKVTISDPNDANFGDVAFINTSNLSDTYTDSTGTEKLKYTAVDDTSGTPFYAYDNEDKKVQMIKPELAISNPGRYTKVSQDVATAFAADPDGIFTQEELRAVGTPMQVYDTSNKRVVDTITPAEFNFRKSQGLNNPNSEYATGYGDGTYSLTSLGSGPAQVLSKDLQGNIAETRKSIEGQITNTNVLLGKMNALSEKIAENPEASVVGVGPITTFITGFKSVMETTGLLNSSTYQEFIANQDSFISRDTGKNWSEDVERISTQYQIQQSQIKDLAYLFAAARGQEGKGLSDKDWANALQIVSGGVNARQKLAVMDSIATSMKNELKNKIELIARLGQQDPEYDQPTLQYYNNIIKNIDQILPGFSMPQITRPTTQGGTINPNITPNIPNVNNLIPANPAMDF